MRKIESVPDKKEKTPYGKNDLQCQGVAEWPESRLAELNDPYVSFAELPAFPWL
jgi:hypothetical protein